MPAPPGEVCSQRTRGASGLEGSRATATVKSTLAIHDETIRFGLGRPPSCILYLTNQLAEWIRRGMPGISGFALPSGVPVAAP